MMFSLRLSDVTSMSVISAILSKNKDWGFLNRNWKFVSIFYRRFLKRLFFVVCLQCLIFTVVVFDVECPDVQIRWKDTHEGLHCFHMTVIVRDTINGALQRSSLQAHCDTRSNKVLIGNIISRWTLTEQMTESHHVSLSKLCWLLNDYRNAFCVHADVSLLLLSSVCLMSLLEGKRCVWQPLLCVWQSKGCNSAALSNLCRSETSPSISSADRCRCSMSPLGPHSFLFCLQLFACVRPLQIHQVRPPHPASGTTTSFCKQHSSDSHRPKGQGLIINIQTPISALSATLGGVLWEIVRAWQAGCFYEEW